MHRATRRRTAVVLAVLAVLGVVVPMGAAQDTADGPSAGDSPTRPVERLDSASATQVTSGDAIRQTQTYARVVDTPGEVAVNVTYEIPDRVVELETRVPAAATVTDTEGFRRVNETTFEWDERTETATVRYRFDPNRTVRKRGPEGAAGRYLAVDTGEWALFVRSLTPTKWSYTGRETVGFERNVTTAGPGAAGEELVYLGDVATFERTAHNQTFRLVVPDRATMADSPIAVLDSMTTASNALRVGDRDETVFVVAARADSVDWGVQGFQIGDADMWVQADRPLDTANNVWLHEYVHTRQAFGTTRETRWLTEATATYYAAALTVEQDRIGFGAFRDRLDVGSRSVYDEVVLSDPGTWQTAADYNKGSLVAGRIDKRIREESNRERTLQDVVTSLNGYSGSVSQDRFLAAIERAGGRSVRNETVRYTETPASVAMWNESVHMRVFGRLPARIGYSLPPADDRDGYRVRGVYRETAVDGSEPIRLVTGETLVVDAVVSNAGGTEGTYNATLEVNGTAVATERGQIAAGDRLVVPLSQTFATPGRYEVGVDGENVTVVVARPATARVTDLTVSSRSVKQWDAVDVTATVVNSADIPARASVVFTRDAENVSAHQLYLPPQTTTQVSSSVTLSRPGNVTLSATGGPQVEVTVTAADSPERTPTATSAAGESGDGFTAAVTLIAVVLATVFAWARSR